MAESMEWKVLFQLKEKYPDYNGFFNMSSLEEDIQKTYSMNLKSRKYQ